MRLLCAFFLLLATSLCAQVTVDGTVRDKDGNALPAVKVTLQHETGTSEQTTTTDAHGAFLFPVAVAGAYELKTEATGFFAAAYKFTLRPRQPISLTVEISRSETASATVEVHARYQTID